MAPWDWRESQQPDNRPQTTGAVVANGVAILSLLPNPAGEDVGKEQVTIFNGSGAAVNLTGWTLRDKAGNTYRLAGTVAAGREAVVTMTSNSMPLNNDGDTVTLIDAGGVVRNQVSYTAENVKSGVAVTFAK